VYRDKKGFYVARIMLAGHYHFLGRFDTLKKAAEARKRGEEDYYHPLLP
jgi:hypothetical protein